MIISFSFNFLGITFSAIGDVVWPYVILLLFNLINPLINFGLSSGCQLAGWGKYVHFILCLISAFFCHLPRATM